MFNRSSGRRKKVQIYVICGLFLFLHPMFATQDGRDSTVYIDSSNHTIQIDSTLVDSVKFTKTVNRNKAEFIFDIASQIVFPNSTSKSTYRIGINGRTREIRNLFDTLQLITDARTLHDRPVELFNFRNTRQIVPVDLLYISADSKLRIKDINKKLKGHSYIIVTENFPFGTSMLNFTVDENDNVQFELQDQALIERGAVITDELLIAPNRILIEEKWGLKLKQAQQKLKFETIRSDKQENIIEEQIEEIVKNEELISEQKTIIILSAGFILLMIGMILLITRLLKQRNVALNEISQKNKEITDSINYAQDIQLAMLPMQERVKEMFTESFVLYLPKDIISGDFYWIKTIESMKILCVADCTGHGVPGALLSILGNQLLSYSVDSSNINNPAEILQIVDRRIRKSLNQKSSNRSDGMDMAIISYDTENKNLVYAGANRPLVHIHNNDLKTIKATRKGLGGYDSERTKKFHNIQVEVNKGDWLYLFSDGLQDQFGGEGRKKFMIRRLNKLFLEINALPPKQQRLKISQAFYSWKGKEEQLDDICVIGIRV